jgi:hypothetical protein
VTVDVTNDISATLDDTKHAASVLHGPSGLPGTKKSQTSVGADLRRLSFADCDSCRSHNGQGKIGSASRLGRPERRCPLIDLIALGHAAPPVLTGI